MIFYSIFLIEYASYTDCEECFINWEQILLGVGRDHAWPLPVLFTISLENSRGSRFSQINNRHLGAAAFQSSWTNLIGKMLMSCKPFLSNFCFSTKTKEIKITSLATERLKCYNWKKNILIIEMFLLYPSWPKTKTVFTL